jgi:hypothetical protein
MAQKSGFLGGFVASELILTQKSGRFRRLGEGATVCDSFDRSNPLAFLGAMQHIACVAGRLASPRRSPSWAFPP